MVAFGKNRIVNKLLLFDGGVRHETYAFCAGKYQPREREQRAELGGGIAIRWWELQAARPNRIYLIHLHISSTPFSMSLPERG